MNFNNELDLLKQYMHLRIACLFAVGRGNHVTKFGRVKTTLWECQIPSFDEFKCLVNEKGWKKRRVGFVLSNTVLTV